MRLHRFVSTAAAVLSLLLALGLTATGSAGEKKDLGGWGIEGEYNQFYKNTERDQFKGTIKEVREVTPLPGMSPGIALVVEDRDDEEILVHLAPRWYVDQHPAGLRPGDAVKVKGTWAEIDGEDVFMAAKVKQGEFEEYKVRRTRDGMPFWAMDETEREKERASE